MSRHRTLGARAQRFRERIVAKLLSADAERFWYIDQNTCAGACPVCGGRVSVCFHGLAPRADLECHGGCSDGDLADAFALEVI
jgi:hypothetical protein